MNQVPQNFAGPSGVAAGVGAIVNAVKTTADTFTGLNKTKKRVNKILSKAQGFEGASAPEGGSGGTNTHAENIHALGEVLGSLMDKSAGHDVTYAKTKGTERRRTTASSVRQLNKINAKAGNKMSATMGRKGSVTFEGTRGPNPEAPAAKKPVAKRTTTPKPPVKAAAPKKAATPKPLPKTKAMPKVGK